VVADFNSSNVALPFDPSRARPELVGFLLHPVSRSETWRRLVTARTRWKVREAFTPSSATWLLARSRPHSCIAWRTCPGLAGRAVLEETEQRKTTRSFYARRPFFSSKFGATGKD